MIPYRNLCILLCVYLLGGRSLFAQMPVESTSETSQRTIRQILFVGQHQLSRQQLEDRLDLHPGEAYDPKRLEAGLDAILRTYREKGYAFVQLTPQIIPLPREQVQIVIQIEEFPRVTFGEISIQGTRVLTEEAILRELKWYPGKPLDGDTIETGLERLLQWYSEIGHPKAEASLQDVVYDRKSGRVNFTLTIDEGPEVRIGAIEVEGLKKTRPEVVRREIPLRVGERYDQRRIDAAIRRLDRLGFFYSIDPVVLAPGDAPDRVNFHARVTEARTGHFNGLLGYAPVEGQGSSRLTGMLEVQETNLFGTGRKLRLFWKSGLLASYELAYEEPWILGHPLHLRLGISGSRQQDRWTEAVSRDNGGYVGIRSQLTTSLQATLQLSYKRIQLPDPTEEGTKWGITLSIERDSRDERLNPTRGRLDRITWEQASGDFRLSKLWIDLNQYWQTWPQQVVAVGLHGAQSWGTSIPTTELFYLGGANTLRGYQEDWFRGPARLYANIEYRFLIGRSSQLFLFLDMGTVSELERPHRFGRLHLGYGIGLRLESRMGAIRLDYGIAPGLGALEGKVHLSVAPTF